ncbi:MAG: hypothetical protein ACYC1D_14900 [Acidimicrobiales bacterium]
MPDGEAADDALVIVELRDDPIGADPSLTEAKAAEIVERVHNRHPGRPFVSGDRERTPVMTAHVTRAARGALERNRFGPGRPTDRGPRDALDEYIRRHAS